MHILFVDEETSDIECTKRTARKRKYIDNEANNEKSDTAVNYFFNFSDSDEEETNNKNGDKRSSDLNIPNYEELVRT